MKEHIKLHKTNITNKQSTRLLELQSIRLKRLSGNIFPLFFLVEQGVWFLGLIFSFWLVGWSNSQIKCLVNGF